MWRAARGLSRRSHADQIRLGKALRMTGVLETDWSRIDERRASNGVRDAKEATRIFL